MTSRACEVLVIGGGASGLACAWRLADKAEVTVLEARDRLGGRILSLRERAPVPFELGAEFIHGWPKESASWVRRAGLSVYRAGDEQWVRDEKGLRPDPRFWERISRALKRLEIPEGKDGALAECLPPYEDPKTLRLLSHFVGGFHAAPPDRVSARSLSEAGVGEDSFRVRESYQALIDWLAGSLAEKGVSVQCNAIVREIRWTAGKVEAVVSDGAGERLWTSSRAVITLPVSLLQLGLTDPDAVRFLPPLLAKASVLKKMAMGSVTRILLTFSKPFWEEEAPELGFVHAPEEAFPTWWTAQPSHHPLLTGWAGGPKSEALRSSSEEALRGAALGSLAKIFDRPAAELEKLIVSVRFHDWDRDRFSRGAYSYLLPGGIDAPKALAEPIQDTLYFAGEATHSEGQNGTVDGALESGARAAEEILEAIWHGTCNDVGARSFPCELSGPAR